MAKTYKTPRGTHLIFCPGCNSAHELNERWVFNGDKAKPTFTPSILVFYEHGPDHKRKKFVCHSYITDGKIQFLEDTTHELSGTTVELPEY